MPAETVIECASRIKRFGHFTPVDHVSFAVGKGSIFGFLGPNSSDKFTLAANVVGGQGSEK
jgi:ABC-2 type transport system ATP-binding protein